MVMVAASWIDSLSDTTNKTKFIYPRWSYMSCAKKCLALGCGPPLNESRRRQERAPGIEKTEQGSGSMVELITLKDVSSRSKIELLRELGYESDGKLVLRNGEPVVDEYVGEKVTLDNMLILPGSTVVITDHPLSIATYFEEHGDWD